MQSTIGLRDYQTSNPDLTAYPTLSQSGALALVLARRQEKAATRVRRDARRKARHMRIRTLFRAILHTMTTLPVRQFRSLSADTPRLHRLKEITLPTK